MVEQITNPCPCFKDVIQAHFYLKRDEIIAQVEGWIKDMENDITEKQTSRTTSKRSPVTNVDTFKNIFQQLKEKLLKLSPPECIEGEEQPQQSTSSEGMSTAGVSQFKNENQTQEIDIDVYMEKMVNDMCE